MDNDITTTATDKHHIGTLNEKPLHAALKQWYSRPGDHFEVKLDKYFIDIVRGEELIEIQTRSLGALRTKLKNLLKKHPVTLIHPIAKDKWIVRVDSNAQKVLSRRKSPKRGSILTAFSELVSIPQLLTIPNLKIVLPLIEEEELRQHNRHRARRRKGWVVKERRLLRVVDSHTLQTQQDYMNLLPKKLPDKFTTADLSKCLACPQDVSQQIAYCLNKMNYLERVGKSGRHFLYVKGNL